jgi:3-deoxy-7-phosphoheptulonate synthase
MKPTQNLNIRETVPLISPQLLKADFPMTEASNRTILRGRESIQEIIQGKDPRFLVIVGPCSIHDPEAAFDYASRLNTLRKKYEDRLFLVMRVYFEKPRTTIGWKGLINDPHLDGSYDVSQGLSLAREILLKITALGIPTASELLDPITPQYIADLITWTAIGARTTESQTHREMASGLSMPVGFKNNTDGSLQVAIDAMESARHPHHFLGIDVEGQTCIVKTKGNPWGHLVLRGGKNCPNYESASIRNAKEQLIKAGINSRLLIDCSHANSGKKHERQEIVFKNILEQYAGGEKAIMGVMVESNLFEGNQKFPQPKEHLKYGVSITDECVSWETTERILTEAYQQLNCAAGS